MLLSSLTLWVIGALCTLIPTSRAATSTGTTNSAGLYEELGGPSFRTPKNILFGVTLGGSSHASWVVRILNELADRGHNVSYAGTDIYLKFAKPFPRINIVDLGESVESRMDITNMQNPRTWQDRRNEIQVDIENYDRIFERVQEAIKTHDIDVLLADSFSTACFDAAREAEIPSIVMMLINLAPDALTPYVNKEIDIGGEATVEHMPLSFRIYKKFLYPFDTYLNLNSLRQKYNAQRERAMGGRPVLENPHVNSLKIVNSFYGIEEARPMGPLVEMIGPIFNGHYPPMTPQVEQYLESHHRVLYIAFGQFAAFEPILTKRVLVEALEILEEGLIDGFLWGVGSSTARLPETVTTRSGNVYNVDELWGDHPDARLIPWAPQFPILRHPSVITFLSHGGGMSVFESLYGGVRTVIRPFFGDQPAHALHYEREKLGGYLDLNRDRPFDILREVIVDKDGIFQKNTDRYQAMVQLHSQQAVARGADLVEEVLFASKDGILPHRVDIVRKVSFLKANDYDLYLYLAGILIGFGLTVRFLYRQHSKNHTLSRSQQKKLKKL
ncbi:hypothetical protein BDA99DRAFT_505187 [Phascolomyces articulosus]|uniref:UDP-glycosyltransferases domain-containing protein n=1 Tax=Phascolomyces articulosus TaxID=60185 RepID=A0AAD5K3X8_9FUNG|nr:hypothetical protein BDA99DRAFT_505187 [Phascolomyces articulosus]